jgi:hypothetical protein
MASEGKILISFSGGETSAYMTQELFKQFTGWKDMIVVFANTGEENEATLQFIDKCDKFFGWNVVWVEAVVNPINRKGITSKIVTFGTASRNGEPFEASIKKYGIPNMMNPNCSRDLKKSAIRHYAKSIGWKDYQTAIGIRADEVDRISEAREKENLYYPLIAFGTTKPFINRFWRDMPFRLELKGYEGNCKVCWKKSLRKHLQIAKENPSAFDNFKKWEEQYGGYCPDSRKESDTNLPPFRFFRNNLSVSDIMELSKKDFAAPKDDAVAYTETIQLGLFDLPLDTSNGCIESCEVF